MNQLAILRHSLRQQVKRDGRAKVRSRCLYFLSALERNPLNETYVKNYRQACRDVLGGEW